MIILHGNVCTNVNLRGPRPHLVISSIFLTYPLSVSIQTLMTPVFDLFSTLTLHHDQKIVMTDLHSKVCTCADARGPRTSSVINSKSSTYTDLIDITHDDNFHQALSSNVVISSLDTGLRMTGNVHARKAPDVDFMTLSRRWCISPHKAKTDPDQTHPVWCPKMLGPIIDPTLPDQ